MNFPLISFTVLFLFFFQSLSTLIEAIYALCLLRLSINENIAGLAFLFSPLLLVFFRRALPGFIIPLSAVIMVTARIAVPWLDTAGKMLASGISVAAFLIFLPAFALSHKRPGAMKNIYAPALAFAVLSSAILRAMGSTLDLSLEGTGGLLAAALGALALFGVIKPAESGEGGGPVPPSDAGWGARVLMTAGLAGAVAAMHLFFTAPAVLSRWMDTDYRLVSAAGAFACAAYVALRNRAGRLSSAALFAWNLVFSAALSGAVLSAQMDFPPNSSPLYPLSEPRAGIMGHALLIAAILLSPVLFEDAARFLSGLGQNLKRPARAGLLFTLFGFLLTVLIFLQILSSVWGYIEPVSVYFRGRYYISVLAPCLLVTAGAFFAAPARDYGAKPGLFSPMSAALLFLILTAAVFAKSPSPFVQTGAEKSIRVLTYNIQQGVNAAGEKDYRGQLDFIAGVGPDLVLLQENDTVRLSGGNKDVLRYFAENLGMYSYYGPSNVSCTYGVGVLSRYPIENPESFHLPSDIDQNGVTYFEIHFRGVCLSIFNNHPEGNSSETREFAVNALLSKFEGLTDIICAGDFNISPDMPEYSMITGKLKDAWLEKWPSGRDDRGLSVEKRIDHVFISASLKATDVRYVPTATTDHPALYADIKTGGR